MTPRGIGLTVGVLLLWLAARTFGIPELQMAAVGCLTLIAAAVAWSLLLPTRLSAERVVAPGTLWYDGTGTVRLTIRNTGRLRSPRLLVEDDAPGTLTAGAATRLPRLAPRERVTVSYRIHGTQRGRFTLGPVTARAQDPFGLVTRSRTLGVFDDVTVYPPIWRLPPGLPLGGSTSTGKDRRRRTLPSGDDLADIREYVRGDDLRSVHWPSTAHRGRLMVRRSESSRSPGAVVVLDRRAERHQGHGATASFETAVAAAASAGYHLSSRGRVITLLDEPVAREPQPMPWEVWLERLATLTPGSVDLTGVLRQIGDGIAGDGTLVAIVTVPDAAELRALVRAGRNFTTRVALVIDAIGHLRDPDPATAAAVRSLRSAGWRAASLGRGARIDDAWREVVAGGRRGNPTVSAARPSGDARPAGAR